MLREFIDGKGVTWKVWDVWPAERVSGSVTTVSAFPSLSFGDGWLCFDCGQEKRRLSPIPPDWEHCDTDALCALCEQAGFITPGPRASLDVGERTPDS